MSMKCALAAVVMIAMVPELHEPLAVRFTPVEDELRADTFQQIYRPIRPQAGESLWMDVPWQTDLHEARRKAAAEGKPLFVQSGGKAISIGQC